MIPACPIPVIGSNQLAPNLQHQIYMIERSNEIIKQLNRLANDRTLPMQARTKIGRAVRHIRELHDGVAQIRSLYLQLSKVRDLQLSKAADLPLGEVREKTDSEHNHGI